jgi:fatty acid desaturase
MHKVSPISRWVRAWEIPTWIVIISCYTAFVALTLRHESIPWWALLPLGALVICLHGSVQHETIHGHPTRSNLVNTLLGFLPLSLWMPFGIYRETHTRHHMDDEELTVPDIDPESFYVRKEDWDQMGSIRRGLLWTNQTLLGRMVVGTGVLGVQFWFDEWRTIASGQTANLKHWLVHFVGLAIVGYWVLVVCEMPPWKYAALFAYPGSALTLVRSFAEHRAVPRGPERTIIVEAGVLMSMLFLNNNFHSLHHDEPGLPWYELRERFRQKREAAIEHNGRYYFRSYLPVLFPYLVRPKGHPVWPITTAGPNP